MAIDETMRKKINNDALAFLRSYADKRNRNPVLAATAITDAKAFTEKEALDGKMIDVVANSEDDLLRQLNGREITRFDGLRRARSYLPPELELVGVRGVRVFTPTSKVFAFPPLGRLFGWAEHAACDAPLLRNLGGFLILIARKRGATV